WLGCIPLNKRSGERNSSFLNLRSDPHPVHRRLGAASLSLLYASNQVAFRLYSPAPSLSLHFHCSLAGASAPMRGSFENSVLLSGFFFLFADGLQGVDQVADVPGQDVDQAGQGCLEAANHPSKELFAGW
ncbi:MAG: hypothetical protein PWP70_1211, partial [Moorella sp. (in: firmicutes)]|nr:hypothetical protein [Moorella sp. (in: firmicutes)]